MYQNLRKAIAQFAPKYPPQLYMAEVMAVENDTATCYIGDMPIRGVRLQPAKAAPTLMVKPKVGAKCIIADISGGEKRDWVMICSQEPDRVEITANEIIINGGENGGMVNIEELKGDLKKLSDYTTALASAVKTALGSINIAAGSAFAGTTLLPTFNSVQAPTLSTKIEDTKLKH